MSKTVKLFVVFCAILFTSNVSAATLTVGFSLIESESDWQAAKIEAAKVEARKRGIRLLISDAKNNQWNQIKAIKCFIAKKVDAIFIVPAAQTGWKPVLEEARNADIPVFILEKNIDIDDDSLYMTAVTADNVFASQTLGKWLASQEKDKQCNIVELKGSPQSNITSDRHKGFMEAIKHLDNIKIVKELSADFTSSKAKEVMQNFIEAEHNDKNICAVYAHNDEMALGAIQALQDAGLKPGEDIKIISIDGVPDIFRAMILGESNATVDINPNMAEPAFDALIAYKNTGKTPPKQIVTTSTLYLPKDAKEQFIRKASMGY